jgi:hypothetical protein
MVIPTVLLRSANAERKTGERAALFADPQRIKTRFFRPSAQG